MFSINEVQQLMETFNGQLKVHALAEYDRLTSLTEDQSADLQEQMQLSDGLILLLEDREQLTGHVESSKENIE